MTSWAWWYILLILLLGRLRQEDSKFMASLGLHSEILSQKQTNIKQGWDMA
jgi:hypothetical protein